MAVQSRVARPLFFFLVGDGEKRVWLPSSIEILCNGINRNRRMLTKC